jgi:hypothetical protein
MVLTTKYYINRVQEEEGRNWEKTLIQRTKEGAGKTGTGQEQGNRKKIQE